MAITPLIGSVNEFIDLALGAVSIMLIWYIIKFFLVPPPSKATKAEKEAEWGSRGEGFRDWVKEKVAKGKESDKKARENAKKKLEAASRSKMLKSALSGIVEASSHLNKIDQKINDKTNSSLHEAKSYIRTMRRTYLPRSLHSLHRAWRDADHSHKDYFHKAEAYVKAIEHKLKSEVEDNMPADITDNWDHKIRDVKKGLKDLHDECSYLFTTLSKYVDNAEMDLSNIGTAPTTSPPTPTPGAVPPPGGYP